jgi:hypothetical protein
MSRLAMASLSRALFSLAESGSAAESAGTGTVQGSVTAGSATDESALEVRALKALFLSRRAPKVSPRLQKPISSAGSLTPANIPSSPAFWAARLAFSFDLLDRRNDFLSGRDHEPRSLARVMDDLDEAGARAKLKDAATGDLLLDKETAVDPPRFDFPEPVMSFAITPKAKGDEEKVVTALRRLQEEDPALDVHRRQLGIRLRPRQCRRTRGQPLLEQEVERRHSDRQGDSDRSDDGDEKTRPNAEPKAHRSEYPIPCTVTISASASSSSSLRRSRAM